MDERVYAQISPEAIGRVLIQLGNAYTPREVLREYISNGVDARLTDAKGLIDVLMDTKQRRIVISDNGMGMQPASFDQLPNNIGEKLKRGLIGEKGIGRLSFVSIGRCMHLITRPNYGDRQYNYQLWEIDKKKGYAVTPNKLTEKQMDDFFYGGFSHGTRVVIDGVDPHIMNNIYLRPDFKLYLRSLYVPALRKDSVDIRLGRYDKRTGQLKTTSIGKPKFESENSQLLIDNIGDSDDPIMAIKINGGGNTRQLEALLFIDPEGVSDKVQVHTNDVLVYPSVTEIEEFGGSQIWGCGKVSGYVNDNFNTLLLSRAGFDRQTNAFRSWYSAMKVLEERIGPRVEEFRSKGRRFVEDKYVSQVVCTFSRIWGRLGSMVPGARYGRDSDGEELNVTGITVPEGTNEEGEGERKKGNGKKGPGPGTFVLDPDGVLETVSPKRGTKLPRVVVDDRFPFSLKHLRYRTGFDLAEPAIFVNPYHENYGERVNAKDKRVYQRYLIEIISSALAVYRSTRLERDGKLPHDPLEVIADSLRFEEEARFAALREFGIV